MSCVQRVDDLLLLVDGPRPQSHRDAHQHPLNVPPRVKLHHDGKTHKQKSPRPAPRGFLRIRLSLAAAALLHRPVLCAAKQCCCGKARKSRPIGYVEPGARMNVFGAGSYMMVGKRFNNVAPGLILLDARCARPVHEKSLATNLTTNVTDSVRNLAQNLHIVSTPFKGLSGASCYS